MNLGSENPICHILTEIQRNCLHSNIIAALQYIISASTVIWKLCLKKYLVNTTNRAKSEFETKIFQCKDAFYLPVKSTRKNN